MRIFEIEVILTIVLVISVAANDNSLRYYDRRILLELPFVVAPGTPVAGVPAMPDAGGAPVAGVPAMPDAGGAPVAGVPAMPDAGGAPVIGVPVAVAGVPVVPDAGGAPVVGMHAAPVAGVPVVPDASGAPVVGMPVAPAAGLPNVSVAGVPVVPGLSAAPAAGVPVVPAVGAPVVPSVPIVPDVPVAPAAGLPNVSVAGVPVVPGLFTAPAAGVPVVPAVGAPVVPSVPIVPDVPAVGAPVVPNVPIVPDVPVAPAAGVPAALATQAIELPTAVVPPGGVTAAPVVPAGGMPAAPAGGVPAAPVTPDVSGATVFDISSGGAKGDGLTDVTAQVNKAWTDSCRSNTPAKLLVPLGEWLVGELAFRGPCTNPAPITIEVQGNLKAKPDLISFPSGMWIHILKASVHMMGGGILYGQGEAVWKTKKAGGNLFPDSIVFYQCASSSIENINIVNSKGFNMKVVQSDGFKANMLNISCAEDSPNTDGIHIGEIKNISITNSVISVGDDCISIGDDSADVTITNITCGPGHGISVGSLGKRVGEKDVRNVAVSNCTFRNTTNGARIKTFHESPVLQACNISFTDILIENVSNPIIIDQNYFAKKPGASLVKITGVHFKNFRGSSWSHKAISLKCSDAAPCEALDISDIDLTYVGNEDKKFQSECVNAKPIYGGKMNPVGC